MKQPVKNIVRIKSQKKKNNTKKSEKNLDGSGLETFFRENVLEKLGIRYQQQFEAKSIGRFYDFYLPDFRVIIECDGFFFHSDPRFYKEGPVYATQKRNKRVDEYKNQWALANGYLLLRFWEHDILNDTENVKKFLTERLNIRNKTILLEKSKKDGSFFMDKNKS